MFKVFLCIPPDYDHNFPPLGTPALMGFLKSKGVDTFQRDLNLEYRDFLLRHLKAPLFLPLEEKKPILKVALKQFFGDCLKDRYYSSCFPRDTDGISAYLPYDNNTNSSFYFTERLLSSHYLWRYLEDKDENTFLQFYEKIRIIDFFKKQDISFVGISIISPSQAIASLTLGLMIKRYLPHIHVNIGGQWPTLYRHIFLKQKEFFRCFDSIIVFEGETPLYRLVESLKSGKKIVIPNVMTVDGNSDFSFDRTEEDLDHLPCPDFDGLPLREYDGALDYGALTTTFETSRGCYWSRCVYCVDLPLPKPTYRRKNPELVARDMKQLKEKYGIGMLMFGDPGLSPRQMKGISKEILKNRLDMKWWTMARMDPGFNSEIFSLAASAGLKQVNFGFECASDRLCDFLDKGNKKETSARLVKECALSGISVGLQTMLGLPGETWEEGLETINFLVTHKDFISDPAFNVYYVTPSNYVYENPKKYGLEIERDPALPFQFFMPFKNPHGISRSEAQLLENLYASLMAAHSAQDENISDQKMPDSRQVVDEEIEFSLNGEVVRMRY